MRAAVRSRLADSQTSMACPYWSIARYRSVDLDVGLVDEPPITRHVAAGTCRFDELWCEALDPTVDADVINGDATLGQQLFDVAVGQAVPQVPAHCDRDHLTREAKASERRGRRRGHGTSLALNPSPNATESFDPVSSLQRQNDPDALVNFRTPRLDLDSVYGRGPADDPFLYEDDGMHLRLGKDIGPDGARDLPRDRRTEEGSPGPNRALIGDPRNDENKIVAQLHAVFLRFHNAVLDKLAGEGLSGEKVFKQAQRLRWHYQWLVLHDFLPTILGQHGEQLVNDGLFETASYLSTPDTPGEQPIERTIRRAKLLFYHPENQPFIPLEFSVAAYRFGHSMIRGAWTSREHLERLLGAKPYRNSVHDVLVLDTQSIVEDYAENIRGTGTNTGATIFPSAPPRGAGSFMTIADFPFAQPRRGRKLADTVVELCVIDGVDDVEGHVIRVERRKGADWIETDAFLACDFGETTDLDLAAAAVPHPEMTRPGDGSQSAMGAVALLDRAGHETGVMTSSSPSLFDGYRFPREVISLAVRWYLRYGLSYRDVEELLAERGVTVDHITVYRWVQRFTPEFVAAARTCRRVPGGRWFVDETYVKANGRWTYLYRAIDQYGQVIDVWLSTRRDLTAARAFFHRALATGVVPVEVTTDRAPVYPRILDELVPGALHTTKQHANNTIKADHGGLQARLRPMRGFKTFRSARILATGHAFVQNLRRGHYDIATDAFVHHRVRVALDELALAI